MTSRTESHFDRTPEDVVIHILGCLVPEYDDIEPESKTKRVSSLYKWLLPIISVCRRLRNTALGTPKLWTWVPIGYHCTEKNQQWLDLCHERAQMQPVNLLVNICFLRQYELELIDKWHSRAHALRLETLLRTVSDIRGPILRCIFGRSWPLLKELWISEIPIRETSLGTTMSFFAGSEWPKPWLWHGAASTLISLDVSSEILEQHRLLLPFTHLRQLKLRRFRLMSPGLSQKSNWQPPHLPRLEHICLLECSELTTSMVDMIRAVALRTVCLRSLHISLDCANSSKTPGGPGNGQIPLGASIRMNLPCLDSVKVEGDVSFITGVLMIIPDPQRTLEFHETKSGLESGTATSATLLTKGLAYLVPADGTCALPSAEHITTVGPSQAGQEHFSLSVTPSWLSSERVLMRRVSLSLLQEPSIDILTTTPQLGACIRILPYSNHEVIFSSVAAALSQDIERLILPEWDTYWTTAVGAQRLLDLEIFLSDLMWQERTLRTLELYSISGTLDGVDILARWFEEGLIMQVVFKGEIKTFNDLS